MGDDQQLIIQQTLERFLRTAYSPPQRRALLRSGNSFAVQNWRFFADVGLLGLPYAERDGGFGGSLSDVMSVMRHLGGSLVLEPYLACVVIAGRMVAHSGSDAQKERWLTPLIAGEGLVGLAHLERGDRARGEVREARLSKHGKDYELDGAKILVPVPSKLDTMLVTARGDGGALHVCAVSRSAAGVTMRGYHTVDGCAYGDVVLRGVAVEPGAVLELEDAQRALDEVLDYAGAALCADSFGCMQSLLEMTVDYAKTRKQFGQPIGRFQALKHRLVDCHASLVQAQSMLEVAAGPCDGDWSRNVAAARAFIDEHAVRLGHEAIQMHGGMGLTDELAVSHYHKRIVMNSMLFGDRRVQIERFIRDPVFADSHAPSAAVAFEALLSPEEAAFRAEVRAFLAENLSDDLRRVVRRQTGTFAEKDTSMAWQKRLNARGWLAPLWPAELGGTGWTPMQQLIFQYESAAAGAPEQIPMGLRYVGPVIAQFGSEWQKRYFLPKILASEHYWAQGFSEPGAGSDLAGIQTTAVLEGDHYIINGSKMWTTHAHYADWLFCIARTERCAKPQQGISFLLIDLKSPGVTIEPIALLAIDHEVNQVFLNDVRVPVANLVGGPGRGWEYTKFLLQLERGGSVFSGGLRHELGHLKELASAAGLRISPDAAAAQSAGLLRDSGLAQSVAALELRLMALERLEFRMARSRQRGDLPGADGSLSKLIASELQKDITEAAMQAAGYSGLELNPDRPLGAPGTAALPGLDLEAVAMPRYLNMRVASIYGGSSEVQREIIARQVLDLR